MNQSRMLHQMCHEVLTETDIRAICKNRGLPNQVMTSRPMLESLFLSDVGVGNAMRALDRRELVLLHLLRSQEKPVDVAFFLMLNPPKGESWRYGTFTQRFQSVFTSVKDRLVRAGILLLALGPETLARPTKMERWQFALPSQFARHLPPLFDSAKRSSDQGNWREDAAREKLKSVSRKGAEHDNTTDRVEIVNSELCWGGQPFRSDCLHQWLKLRWELELALERDSEQRESRTQSPVDGVLRLLGDLEADIWSDGEMLSVPLDIYCGFKVDAAKACDSGWRWGFLTRQEIEGRSCYRLAPATSTETPPERYLAIAGDDVTVDLNVVPFDVLELIVGMSDQKILPGGKSLLLITPNLLKLGRTVGLIAELPLTDWIQKNASTFRQAFETVGQRRGKTILHESLAVARVSDLSLKVALEKALGSRIVSLSNEFIAFPTGAVAEVKRLVTQMGHVVKEVVSDED